MEPEEKFARVIGRGFPFPGIVAKVRVVQEARWVRLKANHDLFPEECTFTEEGKEVWVPGTGSHGLTLIASDLDDELFQRTAKAPFRDVGVVEGLFYEFSKVPLSDLIFSADGEVLRFPVKVDGQEFSVTVSSGKPKKRVPGPE